MTYQSETKSISHTKRGIGLSERELESENANQTEKTYRTPKKCNG